MKYEIRDRSAWGETLATINAATLEDAAEKFGRRGSRRAVTLRTTGSTGLSGIFQAYVPVREGGMTSTGEQFHVREASHA
jgi:hypothetical protein